uniref:Piwi domain-containing protein n=1 Tax=Dracunculus medinensis TaxID=318479 RepID=A0A0N4U3I1_DRAME
LKDPSKAHFGQEDYPKLNDGKAVYIGVHKSATFVEGPKGKGSKFAAIVVDRCKKRIIFRISGVSAKSARTESFEYSGETLTIEQYYHKRYNIQLQYPNAPLLISKKSQNTCLFPMELSYVIEGQRVSQEQQTPKQLISMRTACIIPPAKRKVQNDKNVEAIHLLDNNNQWVARAGIDVIKRPLQVDARILPNPKILYGYGNASQVDPEKWSFGKNRFRRAATITTWAAYEILAIRGNANRRCSSDLIKAMERKYGIVTQDIKKSIASAVINKGKWQTMENIILKTNIKMGGINYIILGDEKPDRLIIGLAMSHPTDGINPSNANGVTTVGYAANTGESQLEFIGDFSFQRAGSTDVCSFFIYFIFRILERYVKQYNCNPSEVLIYRSGISEGQYKMALTMEIPLIRKALQMCGCPELPITYIVVTRLHNIRFMPPKVCGLNQNIRPGVVIDKQVVHPKFKEFYLNAHKTLQGTAKVPRYTVIVDDKNMSMDELEVLTYSLCFCHQIVTLTTSVPTPLYIAGLYADRGRRLMWNISGNSGNTRGPIDLEKLNQEIPYEWSNLKTRRINA